MTRDKFPRETLLLLFFLDSIHRKKKSKTINEIGVLMWISLRGEGNGNPLQYSCLENPMDRQAWRAIIYGVTKSQT